MLVTHLDLTDFRNYERADVALVAGSNVFVGSNGQGKTNLVEALGYLSTLGSHRVSSDHAMIRQGCDSAIVRARLRNGEREILAEVQLNRSSANRAQINRSAIKTRDLPRYFSSVTFAPEDLALVRGEPSGRRRFLDELLVLRNPRFAGVFADYDRVLRQRNTLLKSIRTSGTRIESATTLDIWDDRLITLGTEIIEARLALVATLLPEVSRAYLSIAGEDHAATLGHQLTIVPDADTDAVLSADGVDGVLWGGIDATRVDVRSRFTAVLASVRRAEVDRATTLVGPHRDDLVLGLNGMPARGFASHGESWSFALSLKLASAQVLRAESASGDPVLILDDVFAELDQSRRARLGSAVVGFEQVLITAAVLDDIPVDLAANMVHIAKGKIIEAPVVQAASDDAESNPVREES